MRPVPTSATEVIKQFEGFRSRPYLCPAKVPTIGYGTTHYKDGRPVRLSDAPVTKLQASDMLLAEAYRCGKSVLRLISVPLTDGEYAALISFVYNLGSGRLEASTLRARLNRGDYDGAAEQFEKWVYAGGEKLSGLVLRRKAEQDLFLQSAQILTLPWLGDLSDNPFYAAAYAKVSKRA
jgi:lysozyme